jgi:hypothetical protein
MLMLRKILYYSMLWLRPLFLLTSRWLQILFTGAFGLVLGLNLLVDDFHTAWWIVGVWGGLAFGIFMLRESYDSLLLKLNPTGSELILFK